MVEQLSFGRTMPRLESCLGLHLSPEAVFLAEVKLSGGRPQVVHLVRLPVPGAEAALTASKTRTVGTLNTDLLEDQEKLVGLLKKALSDIAWGSKHVMITFAPQFGLLRYFAMPAIDRRFWKTAVPAEAKKFVPIPFGSLAHDYQVRLLAPGPDRKPRMGALFGVTHAKNAQNIRALMEKVGLTPVGTELAPCSVERLWDCVNPQPSPAPYAQVHFDGGHIRILISDGGLPVFFREVFLPSDATVLDRRKIDLGGCIDFARKQIGLSGQESVRLSGKIGEMGAWRDALAEDLGKQIAYIDVDKELGLRAGQWGGYAAIGSALRPLTPTPITLDLSGINRITDEDRHSAKAILLLGILVGAGFLAAGAYRYLQYSVQNRTLGKMSADAEVYKAFQGKTSAEVEQEIDSMRAKVNSFGAIAAPQVPLTYLLEALSDTIPRSAWVTEIAYENPLSGGRKQARKLSIAGCVSDRSRAIEQDIAYKFAEALRQDERFKMAFPLCDPEVTAPSQDLSESRDAGENLDTRERNATRFTIRCRSLKEEG